MPWNTTDVMDQRTEFAIKALKTDNFRALCRDYGISAKTGYKWRNRLLESGVNGLAEDSRRPKSHPEALGEEVICEMVRLKTAHPSWGPRKIRALYERAQGSEFTPSESSFKRVLERAGLTEKRGPRRKPASGRIKQEGRAQKPNEVWTVDFKGWWYDSSGRRCEPLTVRDEYSRYLLELHLPVNARTETVRERFERLFERHGLPATIRSDNGVPFASARGLWGLSRLSAWWLALGIDLARGRPGHPQDNGAHERLHRDLSVELEPVKADQNVMDQWREEFNHHRPHEALSMRTPAELYQRSTKAYPTGNWQLDYPEATELRRVTSCGTISWANQSVPLSQTLGGWDVGLKPAEANQAGLYEVWFSSLLIGWLDPSAEHFLRSDVGS